MNTEPIRQSDPIIKDASISVFTKYLLRLLLDTQLTSVDILTSLLNKELLISSDEGKNLVVIGSFRPTKVEVRTRPTLEIAQEIETVFVSNGGDKRKRQDSLFTSPNLHPKNFSLAPSLVGEFTADKKAVPAGFKSEIAIPVPIDPNNVPLLHEGEALGLRLCKETNLPPEIQALFTNAIADNQTGFRLSAITHSIKNKLTESNSSDIFQAQQYVKEGLSIDAQLAIPSNREELLSMCNAIRMGNLTKAFNELNGAKFIIVSERGKIGAIQINKIIEPGQKITLTDTDIDQIFKAVDREINSLNPSSIDAGTVNNLFLKSIYEALPPGQRDPLAETTVSLFNQKPFEVNLQINTRPLAEDHSAVKNRTLIGKQSGSGLVFHQDIYPKSVSDEPFMDRLYEIIEGTICSFEVSKV